MPSILLIDDDALFRETLGDALTENGYTVRQAADGAEGTRLLRTMPVDLVLTDIVMPRQEGLETIKALRRIYPKLGIIAMSGGLAQAAPFYLKIAGDFGAQRTLQKPFDLPTLLTAITEVLASEGISPPPASAPTHPDSGSSPTTNDPN